MGSETRACFPFFYEGLWKRKTSYETRAGKQLEHATVEPCPGFTMLSFKMLQGLPVLPLSHMMNISVRMGTRIDSEKVITCRFLSSSGLKLFALLEKSPGEYRSPQDDAFGAIAPVSHAEGMQAVCP